MAAYGGILPRNPGILTGYVLFLKRLPKMENSHDYLPFSCKIVNNISVPTAHILTLIIILPLCDTFVIFPPYILYQKVRCQPSVMEQRKGSDR